MKQTDTDVEKLWQNLSVDLFDFPFPIICILRLRNHPSIENDPS